MGGFESKPGSKSLVAETFEGAARPAAPGKQTLTAQLGAIQRKADAAGEAADILGGRGPDTAATALASLPSSGGAALDRGVAGSVERATGHSLGDVQVHSGPASAAAAHSISARAFTAGNHIHLGAGQSSTDASLMAHEAAHTLQQTSGAKVESGVSPADHPLEAEADRVADAAVSGGHADVTVGAGGSIMRDAVSDVQDALSYGAFDWAVTDADATRALSILAGMSQPNLVAAMGRLEQKYKTRLLDNLPDAAKRTSGYTRVLVAMGPAAVRPYVANLLSYGVFDWAVTDADAAEVFEILKALQTAQQTHLVTQLGATLRSRLASNLQRVSVIGPTEYAVLRVCFDATPDNEINTLCHWVALRFHLTVGATSDSTGVAWDKAGLRRCWDVLQVLPPEHVENNTDLKSLTRYRSGSIEGWASDRGEAAIGYGPGNNLDTENEVGAFTDAADPLRGKNMFDATVRHEIGHRVDAGVGGPAYTASDNGGGWQTWSGSDGMAQRLITASGGKISTWADAGEKTAIIDCLQHVISDRAPTEINARLEALPFVANHATDAAQQTKLNDIKGDDAVSALRVAFSHQGPWDLPTGGVKLGDRIFQESYDWPQWVSYKQAARNKKFSRYQFRAPGEWFAEAYATYYQPPGAKGALMAGLDDTTKTWFDASVDPQHGAGGTTPAAAGGAPAPAPGPAPAPAPGGGAGGP
jgi:hypothetical protein